MTSGDTASKDSGEWTAPDPLDVRIETPRRLIRSYAMTDVPAVFEAVNESREQLLLVRGVGITDRLG